MTEEYGDYIIESCVGQFAGLLMIKANKGRLPDCLAGKYTSLSKAHQAIDEYKRSLKPRVSASKAAEAA
jgi:hypothetical protein